MAKATRAEPARRNPTMRDRSGAATSLKKHKKQAYLTNKSYVLIFETDSKQKKHKKSSYEKEKT